MMTIYTPRTRDEITANDIVVIIIIALFAQRLNLNIMCIVR